MKNQVFKLMIVIACITGYQNTFGQCTGGSSGGASLTMTTSWQSQATNGNRYWTFAATAGYTYYFSFCGADGGSSSYDTQISLLTNTGATVAGAYNDDYCGTRSYLVWTCVTSGNYRALMTKYSCSNQTGLGTFVYKYEDNTCPSGLGTGVTNVASLPYASGASTTCGSVNDVVSTRLATSCATSTYYAGEDKFWIFTPAASGYITVNLTTVASNVSLSVFQNCPLSGNSSTCVGFSQGNLSRSVAFCATAGQTYYVMIDAQSAPGCFTYTNLTISAPTYSVACDYTCPGGLGTGVTNVASLPYNNGPGTTCGSVNDFDSTRITTCGAGTFYAGEDKVWVFTPTSTGNVTVTLSTVANAVNLSAYLNCPLNGNSATCIGNSQGNGNRSLSFCVTSGQTYYLIADAQIATGCFVFTDLSITAPANVCNLGTGVNAITLPYSSSGRTTCGKVDDINASNATVCGDNSFMAGEDEVFTFTATGTGTITIKVNTAGVNSAVYVYDGCPLLSSCVPATCVAVKTGTGDKTMCASVISGHTYYIILDSKSLCFTYGIAITFPVATLPGATCGSPYVISTLPTLINQESTECYGDDYNNASLGSCGTSYESGEDKVYKYVATGPICLSITLSGASTNNIGCQVYSGCPGSASNICVKSFGGATSGVLSGSVSLPSAGTYYIIVDTWSSPSFAQYNIKVESNGSVNNDLPCNAQPIALGFFYSGSNHCASGGGDPAAPACWVTPNTINSVWYSFVAPSSGNVVIRTALGTLKNPQIAVYTGTCGSGLTYVDCNDNAPSCGGGSTTATKNSQLALTGLTAGATYYIVVDGYGVATGTFSLIVQDGSVSSLPSFAGQECDYPILVCNGTMTVGDPGFQDFGNKCDFPGGGSNCLSTAERGSAWYQLNISAAGNLEFDIVPNDWPGAPSTSSTDYDFAVWKIAGASATSCTGIAAGDAPLRCNYSPLGVTGCYGSSGNSPAAYPGYNGSYQPSLAVVAGEVYLIEVSNFSNSTSGFTMYFPPTVPIDYTAGSTQAFWTGSVDNDWFKSENWGGCTVPSCTVDAAILAAPANQPYISASGSACRSLNVHPGAVLTISATRTLSICGNLLNNGNILGNVTSTLYFGNAAVPQTMNGNFIYPNTIGNLTVNKSGASLNLMQNLEMSGNLLIQTSNSVLNANNKSIKLEGNLSNNLGQLNMDTIGVLELRGTGVQSYLNNDTLTNVIINNSGGGIDLSSRMLLNNKGALTLTNGKIVTNANEVSLLNAANNAVSVGSTGSYIEGDLRRAVPSVSAARQYDFPVGNSTKGYQRINMNFYGGVTPAIGSLLVNFTSWPGIVPKGAPDVECWVNYSDTLLNNGYWTVTSAGNGNADANITLYNLNYTNSKTNFTVAQSTNGVTYTIPSINSGICTTPPVTAVLRNSVANALSAGIPKYLGTGQGYTSPLPVELVSLIAKAQKKTIQVNWITASERNNAGFYLQRSTNGFDFTDIDWIPGAGTINVEQFYNYDDKNVIAGIEYFYRLNQVDFDGKSTLSKVVKATLDAGNFISLTSAPNPYKGTTQIKYKLPTDGNVRIVFTDVAGRIVRQINNGLQNAGSYSVPFSAVEDGMRSGVYYVTLYFNDAPYRIQLTELN